MMRKRNVAKAKAAKADRMNAVTETGESIERNIDWDSADIPLKLQQWVQMARRDVSSRIFRDMVIRLPFKKSSKDEVMALLEPFGNVQYIQCAVEATGPKEGNKGRSVGASITLDEVLTDEQNASLCHLVRFDDGIDAVKAFMHLNGAVIDPKKHQQVASELYEAIQAETVRLGDDMTDEDREVALMVAESLKPGDLIGNADSKNRMVVVTIDFFRVAVLAGTTTIPRNSLLSNAKRSPKIDFNHHHKWLQQMAEELDQLYPVIVSHDMEWSDFMFAHNYMMFMHATPTAQPWKTMYEAANGVEFKQRRLLQWIDRTQGENELRSGSPTSLTRQRITKRDLFPLSTPAKLFIAILLLVAILVFWLRFTQLI